MAWIIRVALYKPFIITDSNISLIPEICKRLQKRTFRRKSCFPEGPTLPSGIPSGIRVSLPASASRCFTYVSRKGSKKNVETYKTRPTVAVFASNSYYFKRNNCSHYHDFISISCNGTKIGRIFIFTIVDNNYLKIGSYIGVLARSGQIVCRL